MIYRGHQVFEFPVDWSDAPSMRFSYELPVRQIGFGSGSLEPEQSHLATGYELTLDLSPDDLFALELFFQTTRGRLRGWWLPGEAREIDVVQRTGSHAFTVDGEAFSSGWDDHHSRDWWFVDAEGNGAAVRIASVSTLGSGLRQIVTEQALPVNLDATWTAQRLHFVRLERDELEIEMQSPAVMSVRLRCYELPSEYFRAATGELPVWLYEFLETALAGQQRRWRFTSHDASVSALGQTWLPRPIAHGQLVQSTRGGKDELQVESFVFDDNPLLTFFPFPPQRRLDFVLREFRLNDGVISQRFAGVVRRVEATGKILTARMATQLDAEDRLLPRLMIGKICSYRLGDPACGVTPAAAQNPVLTASGYEVTMAGISHHPANWFAGGMAVLSGGPEVRQLRQILSSNGGTLQISAPFSGSPVGLLLRITPGCDKRAATCQSKFDNFLNFGGHPFIDRNLAIKAIKVRARTQRGKK